jgi:Protein of unknown function (DUF1501)
MLSFDVQSVLSRRLFLRQGAVGLGAAALATLLERDARASGGLAGIPHFPPKAKRMIWLTQAGAPSQMDLFDYKPQLKKRFNDDLPDSVRRGRRLAPQSSDQSRLAVAPSIFGFRQCGKAGTWISDLLPHTRRIADHICVIRSMYTEAVNHDPAMTMLQTGQQLAGRPSLGAWLFYGLGSENDNLPAFVVMLSNSSNVVNNAQPLNERMWGAGFLPPRHQAVRFFPGKDPVLFLSNPPGITAGGRRRMLDDLTALNRLELDDYHDPEIQSHIEHYELAFRIQTFVPELADLLKQRAWVFDHYRPESHKPGTYAANCILARRLAERGVRFIQLYRRGWDQHENLPRDIKIQCYDTDQPTAALIEDLHQRRLLDDTLVVWGGEFGRTIYSQGALTANNFGRDHHPYCFSLWMAGAGLKPGHEHGETDDYCYDVVRDPVHVHDLNATILAQLGIDHKRLTYRCQGRDFRLTDVYGEVVKGILV